MADIGVEQNACRAVQTVNLGNPGERCDNVFDTRGMRVAKAAGPQRRPSYRVNLAVCEPQWGRQIIGDALGAKIAQHRKVDRAIASRQPAAQGHPRVVDMHHWAHAINIIVKPLIAGFTDADASVELP
jgi:hypothetical protein